MLNYAIFLELNSLMLQISALSRYLEPEGGRYAEEVKAYLTKLQSITDAHRLTLSSDVAVSIQKLAVFQPETTIGTSFVRRNARKERDAYAVKILDIVLTVVKQFVAKDARTYEEASDLWRQVGARLLAKSSTDKSILASKLTDDVLARVQGDGELQAYYTHLVGLVGVYNARAVLDSVLPQLI